MLWIYLIFRNSGQIQFSRPFFRLLLYREIYVSIYSNALCNKIFNDATSQI